MAQEYSTKLTLKDNFSAVVQKAISATEALRAKLQATEKELSKIGNKKVKIGAQLDSSVNSSLNKLADKIPKDKTIKIKAKDEVTRNVTNMQRDIYKMGREISMGMKDPFKGLNRSTISATGNLVTMRNAARELARSMATSHVAAQIAGNAMAASAAAGVAVGRVTGSRPRVMFYKGLGSTGKSTSVYPDPDYHESKERFHSLGRGDVPARFNRESRSMTYFDGKRADMIEDQQRVMRQRYGKSYLKNYRATDEHIGGGDYLRVLNKNLGSAGFAYHSAKDALGFAYDKTKNAFSFAGREVKMKLGLVTSAAESKLKAFTSKVGKSKIGEVTMRMKFAGQRTAYALGGLKDNIVSFKTKLQDLGARSGLKSILTSAKSLAGRVFSFKVSANTASAKEALSNLKSSVNTVGLLGGAAMGAGGLKAITGAAQMESNSMAIEHFVKYANTRKVSRGEGSAKSDEQIKSESNAYLGKLRKYAVDTPFGDVEVMNAGRRAVNVMNGDLGDAEELVKIAGDMAALNPGKTIMDAMEALADMKTGEMERMKEFGMKISAEQFKGLVGKGKNDDLSEDEQTKAYRILMDHKMKTMFGGGAQKLSTTASGKWSTVTGSLEAGLADIGTMFLPGIKSALDSMANMINTYGPIIQSALTPIAAAFNALMETELGSKIVVITVAVAAGALAFGVLCAAVSLLATPLSMVVTGFGMLMTGFSTVSTVITTVRTAMLGLNLAMLANPVGLVIAGIAALIAIGYVVYNNWDTIKQFFADMWVGPSQAIDAFTTWVSQSMDAAGNWVTEKWDAVKQFAMDMWAGPSAAISSFVDGVYGMIGGAVDWAIGKWQALCDALSVSPSANVSIGASGAEFDGSERAVGMDYIPYNGFQISAHRGEAILSRTEADSWRSGKGSNAGGVVININDPVVREESDLDRLGTMLAQKINEVYSNMGAVPA